MIIRYSLTWKTRFIVALFIGVAIVQSLSSVQAQDFAGRHRQFPEFISDSSGIKIDLLPLAEDSVYVRSREYRFFRVDAQGKVTGGLKVYNHLDLNLALQIGEEEDRERNAILNGFYWLSNFTVRVVSLTFFNPQWGANGFFFDQNVFKTDLRRIIKLYADQGYFETRIVKYETRYFKKQREIEVSIYIQEGKPTRYIKDPQVVILSPKPLMDYKNALVPDKLAEEIPIKKGDILIAENLEVSKSVLQKIFNQHGYPAAFVVEEVDTVTHGRRNASVVFQINPGRYAVFGETAVKGNYYQTRFLKENKPDTSKKIVDEYVIRRKILYKRGRTYNPDLLSQSIGQINALGVFRSVKPLLNKHKGSIDSTVINDEQVVYFLDSVKTSAGNRINRKPLPTVQRLIPVDTMDVVIEVSDRKERSLKPGVGFTTDFRDLPQSEKDRGLYMLPFLSLMTSWQSRNFFGGARKMQVSAKISKGFQNSRFFANYMEAKVTFRQPSFRLPLTRDVNNDLLITLSGIRNNTLTYDLVKYETAPTFIRQLTKELSLNFTPFSFTKQHIRRVYAVFDTNAIRNFYTTNTKIGLTFNNSNDMFYPGDGFLIYFLLDLSGFLLPSDLKYLKVSLDNRKYLAVTKKATVALRFRVASAKPYYTKGRPTAIPISEQFYCGGPNSIRGWAIKELAILNEKDGTITYSGGNSLLESGVEVRYNLFLSKNPSDAVTGTDFALFADAGNVWTEYNFRNIPKELPAQPLVAVGGGFRIRTMIGPVRIDFGYKLVDLQSLKVIHNGVVQTISRRAAKRLSPYSIQITLGQAY